MKTILSLALLVAMLSISCKPKQITNSSFEIIDSSLQTQIEKLDKEFFDAYNVCDIKKQSFFYDENVEFFHDKNGLVNNKNELLESTQTYICGKVTRQLVPGSIEVYPLKNYGAVEIGYHSFINKAEPNAIPKKSKFIIVWKRTNDWWKITKVVSLH